MKDGISNLEQHLGYWLRYVSNHVSQAFARKVEGLGVTVAEWVVLRELYGRGPTAPSQIAENLRMTRGAITKLADRLIAKGMLRREADLHDGRAQTLCLTSEGNRLVPKLAKLADENDAEFFRVLPARERKELQRMLKKIVEQHGWKQIPLE